MNKKIDKIILSFFCAVFGTGLVLMRDGGVGGLITNFIDCVYVFIFVFILSMIFFFVLNK